MTIPAIPVSSSARQPLRIAPVLNIKDNAGFLDRLKVYRNIAGRRKLTAVRDIHPGITARHGRIHSFDNALYANTSHQLIEESGDKLATTIPESKN